MPAGVDKEWSHPGQVIWEWVVPRSELNERKVGCDWHPRDPDYQHTCFRYDFSIPEEEWFYQEPALTIYWISISAEYGPVEPILHWWSWVTRKHYFNDAAVRIDDPTTPTVGAVFMDGGPVEYPAGVPWDMAFVLTTGRVPERPLAEDCDAIRPGCRCRLDRAWPCESDADCRNQSICVPPPVGQEDEPYPYDHVCYVPKLRYLSIARSPKQAQHTARRISLDDGTMLGWVGEPYASGADVHSNPYIVAQVVDTPHYATAWPDIVHVHTCEIAHASLCEDTGLHCKPNACPGAPAELCINHRYGIQAIVIGEDIEDEEMYSEPLWLNTAGTWGDTVGACGGNVCQPADGLAALDDIMAAIAYFKGCQDVAPMTWLDIDPSNLNLCPDQIVGLGDIMSCIAGFKGNGYPGLGPKECP